MPTRSDSTCHPTYVVTGLICRSKASAFRSSQTGEGKVKARTALHRKAVQTSLRCVLLVGKRHCAQKVRRRKKVRQAMDHYANSAECVPCKPNCQVEAVSVRDVARGCASLATLRSEPTRPVLAISDLFRVVVKSELRRSRKERSQGWN